MINPNATGTPRVRFIPGTDRTWAGTLWTNLEQQIDSPGTMCSWVWTETWLRHYGDCVDHCFAVGEVEGKPIGIALVTGSPTLRLPWLRFRGIVHIGTAGEPRGQSVDVECNRLLVVPEYRDTFTRHLVAVVNRRYRPIAIQLDGFPPDVIYSAQASGFTFQTTNRPCPAFDLERARRERQDVISLLGSGVRSRVRRSNRGFEPLSGEWATSPDQALDIYDELVTLHQARWRQEGRRGAFASRRFMEFHREFISREMQGTPRVMLFRLRQGDTTIGCLYGFIDDGVLLFYQSGFIDVTDNRLKPGLSTHAACMQECLDRGLLTYDFLAGQARYKRELANSERMLQTAIAYRIAGTSRMLGVVDRLGLVERARTIKRWRERAAVASTQTQADNVGG